MTAQEFILWLQGFLEATSEIEGHHLVKIKNKLNDVKISHDKPITYPIPRPNPFPNTKTFPWPSPNTNPYNPFVGGEPGQVTYADICSCNPKNGGSGICGCVIGNKIVTTSDNSKQKYQLILNN